MDTSKLTLLERFELLKNKINQLFMKYQTSHLHFTYSFELCLELTLHEKWWQYDSNAYLKLYDSIIAETK